MVDKKKLIYAVIVVLVIVLVASSAWYYTNRYNTVLVSAAAEGSAVKITCAADARIHVVSAHYKVGDKTVDVKDALQKQFGDAFPGGSFTVLGSSLGQAAGGALTFRYKCLAPKATKAGFVPIAVRPCAGIRDDYYGVDMTSRNAAGTVVWDPYSTQSRVSLERMAESPEVATPPNPVTGVGRTSMVRREGDRYRRNEELKERTAYEIQPGQPGDMEAIGDQTTSLLATVSRRSPANIAAAASCSLANQDIDSDFVTDGFYDNMVLKDGFTSVRGPRQNTLTASRTGLGSVRQDPRFEPGPDWRVPGGDASWSHGGHAGGPTSGGFGSAKFAPPANFGTGYVAGFGDPNDVFGNYRQAEVVVEEPMTWTH
jgi:hypothetical protein